MAANVWIFLLNIFFLSKIGLSSPVYLDRVLNALDKMIEYYKNSYRQLNVDGLFGLRVIEGHLSSLIEKYENGTIPGIDPKVVEKLKKMKIISTKTSIEALEFVKKDDEQYFRSMQFVVGNPWSLHKDYKALQFQLVWDSSVYKASSDITLNEKESDRCMMELMGYQPSKTQCGISTFCIDLMTKRGLTGYGITHQVLWTMLSEQAGCYSNLTQMLVVNGKGRPENIQLEFCTNNYVEVMQVVHGTLKGQIIPRFQDLFMEQQFVCPSLGFYQFLSDEFLDQILSWQKDMGCYGTMKKADKPANMIDELVGDSDYDYDEDKVLKFHEKLRENQKKNQAVNIQPPKLNLIHELNVQRLGNVHMTDDVVIQKGSDLVTKLSPEKYSVIHTGQRRLLVEKEMESGCLAHKTAVAAGALIIYLRYLILPGPKSLAENTQDMLQQRHLLNINENGAEKFFPGAKVVNQVSETRQKGHAMNNNVLAAQINNKGDNYYGDENNENDEDEDEDGGGNKNVQIDDHDNNEKNNDDTGYDGDYDNTNHDKHKNIDVKNLADKDKKVVPKPDDTDYTYYEDKNKHDDYTNDEEDENQDNVEKDKENSNDKIRLKLISEAKIEEGFSAGRLQSPSGLFLVISGTIFVLLIFMYRFLQKRRVHIRYNYKNFNKV